MHMVHTNRLPSKRERWINLHDLPLGKTFCHKLPQPDLYRELARLGIPGIAVTMGHQDLSLIYADFLASKKERAA